MARVPEFCRSEVAKRAALEAAKRSEVGELVEHRGAVQHIINPHRFNSKVLEHLKIIEEKRLKG